MDTLSRLLAIYPLRTALDVRCHFGAPWVLDHPAAGTGVAPYHLIVRGSATLDCAAGHGVPLQAGDIVVFPHGGAHRLSLGEKGAASPLYVLPGEHTLREVRNGGDGPAADILCGEFHFDAEAGGGPGLLAALPPLLVVRTAGRPDAASLRSLMAMLQSEAELPRAGSGAVISQLASALFALLIRAWMDQAPTVPGLFALLAGRRLQAALHGMLAQPERPWDLAQLAALCHVSRATFARLFKQTAGATPAEVLARLRMAQAARLLDQGQQVTGSIAEMVGYQSEAAFNRAFKRHHGVGPGAWRRRAQAAIAR
ncbi:MAG TPA: AraC family transcriptional regulator [Burkholderiaceae bacterium]|nr:AraC family transcriptional regulator [Burkholderiaceae bacterium]